ncbi:UNVERIFIED_CONTAM: hypothetical protein Slati_1349700 [Sesamum latifolium]|uniref:Reverse transcriptase zinc-binding domain-containing protein n=1 Tax=Sesamum latifolium TaxID=2727402 RepID=A0AAW2XND2_9LAMI
MPWLPRPHSFQLSFPPKTLLGDAKVAELINGSDWDEGMILSEFEPCDALCILSIKLPKSHGRDILVWHYEKNGKCSTRSAYSLACDMTDQAHSTVKGKSWSFVWKARIRPKMQLFAWRVCTNSLPTLSNLRRRGLKKGEGCPLCGFIEEDVKHAMLLCPLARQVWALSNLPWRFISNYTGDSEEWVRSIASSLDGQEFASFLIICWSIWQHCNLAVFEGKRVHAQQILSMARRESCLVEQGLTAAPD